MKYPLKFVYLLCFAYMLVIPVLFPSLRLTFFAPFIVIAAMQLLLPYLLLASFFCGLTMDLFTTSTPFGFYTLVASISALFSPLWMRSYFKDDTLLLLTRALAFIWIWTTIQSILALIFGLPLTFSLQWIFTDLFLFPLLDLAYMWICILLPLTFTRRIT